MSRRPHNDRQSDDVAQRDRTIRVRRPEGSVVLSVEPAEPSAEFERGWWGLLGDLWPRNQKVGAPTGAPEEEREHASRPPQR